MGTELHTPAVAPLVEIAAVDVTYRDGLRAVEGVSFSLRRRVRGPGRALRLR